ncbi:butyrate kinase [Gracilibacillus ureilyticus]|uniref:Probable butyrate kinase n=1 Tax=Gracilibacillus ureilyticus TaxID=531814 RepID=A0A1H9LWG1_9BACI|nr:butyrate kinase [Gracilibacillus ureilyticus]SER15535.1 butyrate kinase [Gracilibacillus ureilyticus]
MSNKQIFRILVINPLVHSTKIAIYENDRNIFEQNIQLNDQKSDIYDQIECRKNAIVDTIIDLGLNLSSLDAVCGRGGLLRPISGGTYLINEKMILDLQNEVNGKHVSNLGAILAYQIANNLNIHSFIVDPVVVDEMSPIAKSTGLPEIKRKSIFHALNQKFTAMELAKQLNKTYEEINVISAHIDGGVTVGAHRRGEVIDVNNGFDGEGPFSFERSGSLPNNELINLSSHASMSEHQLKQKLIHHSGLKAYLDVKKMDEVKTLVRQKDKKAMEVIEVMAYQIAKEIGKMAAVLEGNVDGIILTGNLAEISFLNEHIIRRVSWIADVYTFPGESTLLALARGTLRVLQGREQAKEYEIV